MTFVKKKKKKKKIPRSYKADLHGMLVFLSVLISYRWMAYFKETKSETKRLSLQLWTFFEKFSFLKMVFVEVELSHVFSINLFAISENCMEKWIIL